MRPGVVIGAVLLVVAVALAFPRSAEVAGVIGGPDRFATPVDVAADLQGRVFVAEREPCRLLRIVSILGASGIRTRRRETAHRCP